MASFKSAVVAAVVGVASAQTWYGIAPDQGTRGKINAFSMTPNGQPIKTVATVTTADNEYPKQNTLHCQWAPSQLCFFLTGVEARNTQDALYGINRITGATVFKHELPANIFVDTLQLNYLTGELVSIAYDFTTRQAGIAQWNEAGNFTGITDITREVDNGFVFSGSASLCPTTGHLFVGLTAEGPAANFFGDHVLVFDLNAKPPARIARVPLYFPLPSAIRAICNATALQALMGVTMQSDSEVRETGLLGDIVAAGREGLFFPLLHEQLPTFEGRGEVALFPSGLIAEHAGTIIAAFTPLFNRGPGPAPAVEGFVWTTQPFGPPGPTTSQLRPLNYYLAGAAGVPTV